MIRGELTNLRAIERTDAPAVYRWFNAVAGSSAWPHVHSPVSLAESQRRIEDWLDFERSQGIPACLYCEALDGTPRCLILFSHFEPDHRALEFGLLFPEPFMNDVAEVCDALGAVIDTCFDQWNLHRVTTRMPVMDELRTRACEMCGLQRDAVLRQAAYFDGRYHDVAVYCLLETDDIPGRERNS